MPGGSEAAWTASTSAGTSDFAFAGRDHVGEQRQRFGIDERHRAADHDQGMAFGALGGTQRRPASRSSVSTFV